MTSAASMNTHAGWGKVLDNGMMRLVCPDCIQAEREMDADLVVEAVDLREQLDTFVNRTPISCDRCGELYGLPFV